MNKTKNSEIVVDLSRMAPTAKFKDSAARRSTKSRGQHLAVIVVVIVFVFKKGCYAANLDEQTCDIPKDHRVTENKKSLFNCPSTAASGTAQNDVAGYFDFYDDDNARHADGESEDDLYFTEGFRYVRYGGRMQTYSKMKKMATEYKASAFGDNLKSGDSIYESACAEGFNLLMTIEILKERRGIENLIAFGNDYLSASAAVADKLFDKQASTIDWIHKGVFCQGDSSNLEFVPSNAFDLAYTGYIDPIVDPLHLHPDDMPFEERVKISRELCESEDESHQVLMQREQAAQEEWHSSWVKELLRIVKPGKVVIIGESKF